MIINQTIPPLLMIIDQRIKSLSMITHKKNPIRGNDYQSKNTIPLKDYLMYG